ncbi:hypothetical protein [Metamycoplasma hyosynoviae]|uniref:hypothetical protein n=1 Tax=Metamycoplasma hyosynoviae TaxID=29559 RepID=UPI000E7064FB|nr:hypothetical protein [Metamycoplasma hyosynoviae]
MNKTTKVILCTAIPVGAASILIPTIVVASLKSKARKTEQDRKLLSDLNLEVEQYLGKITTEIRDANVEQYQELLKLTSKIKNAINNKYLKKEDYRKQLLLLKEKFDNFKEKINPPTNDTNDNSNNTDKENTGDVDSTEKKENPDTNKTNENETSSNSNPNENESSNEDIKTNEENNADVDKQLESKLDEKLENEFHEATDKIEAFELNLNKISKDEKYSNLYKELNTLKEKYQINKDIKKTKFDITYKNKLIDQINDRLITIKEDIDLSNDLTYMRLENKITKLLVFLDGKNQQLSFSINTEEVRNTLQKYEKEIKKLDNKKLNEINNKLSNITLIFSLSTEIWKLHEKLSNKLVEEDKQISEEIVINFNEKNELIKTIKEQSDNLKNTKNWENENYLEYFFKYFDLLKIAIKIIFKYEELNNLFEIDKNFNTLKLKMEDIYKNLIYTSIENKTKIHEKLRTDISNLISNHKSTAIKNTISNIALEIDKIEKNKLDNPTSYVDYYQNRKDTFYSKLKPYENIYDLNKIDADFNKLKNDYEKKSSDEYLLRELEDYTLRYEIIVENIEDKISKYKNLLSNIEQLCSKYNDNKYSFIINWIKKYAKEIQDDKFKNIKDISKVNIIFSAFIETINESKSFIDKLPVEIEKLKKYFINLKKETSEIYKSENANKYLKEHYNKFIDKIEKNSYDKIDNLIRDIYILNEYKNININNIEINGKNMEDFEYSIYDNFIFNLMNEYTIEKNDLGTFISNICNKFNSENIIILKIAKNLFSYSDTLNVEYKNKISKHEQAFKMYSDKINELGELIKNSINKNENIILVNTFILIMKIFDFAYREVDDIFIRNTEILKEMSKLLDNLIKVFKKEQKNLTQ